uniref:Endonuclease/exonuclease/phosphatase domain-containing protein n=1 Tax=Phlebotomus papatasi TaxID=29031 RepID=A0A1B0EXW6_PHLPP
MDTSELQLERNVSDDEERDGKESGETETKYTRLRQEEKRRNIQDHTAVSLNKKMKNNEGPRKINRARRSLGNEAEFPALRTANKFGNLTEEDSELEEGEILEDTVEEEMVVSSNDRKAGKRKLSPEAGNNTENKRTDRVGGVLIGVRNRLEEARYDLVDTENTVAEMIAVKVRFWNREVLFCSTYIPSTENIRHEDLNRILPREQNVLIGDDFNAHGSVWGSAQEDGRGRVLQSWCEDSGLVVLNTGCPTRVACPPRADSAIDVTMVSPPMALEWSWEVTGDPLGSDHIPILATWNIPSEEVLNEGISRADVIREAHMNWDMYRNIVRMRKTVERKIGVLQRISPFSQKLQRRIEE